MEILSPLSRPAGGEQTAAVQARARSAVAESNSPAQQAAPNKLAHLSAMRLFRDLSPEELNIVEQSTFTTTAPKGKVVYMPDETGEALFMLIKGTVHLYRLSSEGRKLIVQTIGPMTFFGEMGLLGQSMHNLFAEATEDSTICAMSRADAERLILEEPQVALRMLEELSQRTRSGSGLRRRISKGTQAKRPANLSRARSLLDALK